MTRRLAAWPQAAGAIFGDGAALACRGRAGAPTRQHVAGLERPPFEAAERAERIGRAAAEHDRHVDAAGDGDIGARAGFEEIEGEDLAAPSP